MTPSSLFRAVLLLVVSWCFVARGFASSCTISPALPVSGQPVTLTYDKTGGPLAAASAIYIHRGINHWMAVSNPDQPMTLDPLTGKYSITYVCPEPAFEISCVFNSGGASPVWDNNSTLDWHFDVKPGTPVAAVGPGPALPDNASRAHVMMQAFYWDVPAGGTWYDLIASKAAGLRDMKGGQGVDRLWFPPASKSESGPFSMGYDPFDYYDLGAYNQKGTVATRFGTQTQLKNAIAALKAQGILAMADIVPNHRSGGNYEANPEAGGLLAYTDFSRVASGKAAWHYGQFHPNALEPFDGSAFAGFPDVALGLVMPNAPGSPRYDLIEWGNWLMDTANAGFTGGWRFDYVMGYRPSFVAEFRAGTGNQFGVMEYWDGNVANVDANVKFGGGTSTFDFPGYYTLRDICNNPGSNNVANLVNPAKTYVAKNPALSVTFVANHDTDEISANRMIAYAFTLTYEGYPCIFWRDYFDRGLATLGGQTGNGINALVWARGALAGGYPKVQLLKTDSADTLVYGTATGTRNSPGYIVILNTNTSANRTAAVTTSDPMLKGTTLRCYAWYSYVSGKNAAPADTVSDAAGLVTVQAPPLGYAVYGPATLYPETGYNPPVLTGSPASVTVASGGAANLSVTASGAGLTYQWLKNGTALSGATADTLVLGPVSGTSAGIYEVDVTNQGGTVRSRPAVVRVETPVAGSLINVSARSVTGHDGVPLIVGFFVAGGSKPLLIRAVGPGLAGFGVTGTLDDPKLELHAVPGADVDSILASNDNWGDGGLAGTLAGVFDSVGAFGLADTLSKDAAFVYDVSGPRTVVAGSTVAGQSGVVIVEAYDIAKTPAPRLNNVSVRNYAGSGSETLIAGFVINGNAPRRILIRAAGPTLTVFGVGGVLADPRLELHWTSPSGDRIFATNDNWGAESGVSAAASASGAFAFPAGSLDSALLVTLPAGNYTAQATGADGGTGIALVEAYDVTDL